MEKVIIYHNPRCMKSRQALSLLQEKKQEIEIIEYLKTKPDVSELKKIVALLGISAEELIRKKENTFIQRFKGKNLNEEDYLKAMSDHPELIERPIIIKGKKAVIGRPPELSLSII